LRLATYSALILFFELALIRFTAGYVHVFSFYLNFVLISTFLGMGVGLLRAEHARLLKWIAIPAMLLVLLTVAFFTQVSISAPRDQNDFVWALFLDAPDRSVPIVVVAASLFAVCSVFFIPLGALVGAEFRRLPPLRAYAWDIGGGLVGIFVFGILSATRQEPLVWFTIGFAVWLLASLDDRRFAASLAVASALSLSIVSWTSHGPLKSYWSPYYRITLEKLANLPMFRLSVNGSIHQFVINLDSTVAETSDYPRTARAGYLKPYAALARIDTALVVGAGTGNDLSLLLMRGAKYIDAVEIDPVIAAIGKDVHFQQPYSDPRVHLHINDARAFLRASKQKYDVIVFGTLDSQTLLSGMSSVRLDNYIYTVESFKSARSHLTADGSLIVYHMSALPFIAAKLYGMVGEAFGSPPAVISGYYKLFNLVLVAGKGAAAVPPVADSAVMRELRQPYPLAHDDWPYLYLKGRVLPRHYIVALGAVLIIAIGLMGIAGGEVIVRGFDGAMFFMGAGFMLVETKSVTEMSLLFGSTWTVNLLVFSSIMVMVLLANLLVMRRGVMRTMPLFGGLFASLLVAYLIPASSLLGLGAIGQWVLGGIMVALPIFFAALIFSTLLGRRIDGSRALAYNLLGAIIGGVLEYGSMITGIKGLYILAALLYLGAMLLTRRAERRVLA
jgi:spermidine synthase